MSRDMPSRRSDACANRGAREGSRHDPNIRLRQTLCQVKFLKTASETWNVSPENIDPGATDFGLAKTDSGGPSYEQLRKWQCNDSAEWERVKYTKSYPARR